MKRGIKKYNCCGKLRCDVLLEKGDGVSEVILLPENGGCVSNIELIGRLIDCILTDNRNKTPIERVIAVLEKTRPCQAPTTRMYREQLPKEEVGLGGCSKIILEAIKERLKDIPKEPKKDS
jgi:hypothetical protein